MGGRIDETNQEIENLERRVIDLEGKLVKLAALEAAFDHFTNEHWIPLQSVVISLHCQADVTSLYCLLYSHVDFSCLLSQQPANFRGRG